MATVRDATFNLLRRLGVTTMVGNPGSTEEAFLQDFPSDFDYVLALQEASVIGIADGLAQGLRKPVIVNLHTGVGVGNGMGTLITAFQNRTPLIVTAGQQTREMLMLEPLLTNVNATELPRPWVKWSCEPARAADVPAAFMRAYAMAVQPPAGPVFLSLPLDDWNHEIADDVPARSVTTRTAPDPDALAAVATQIAASRNPVVVYGPEIGRSGAWDAGIAFAERLEAPVWTAPFSERNPFPETHRLHAGVLPAAIGPLAGRLTGHDLVLVVGAPVFRYYPYVAGDYLPAGAALVQVTDDPDAAARAPVGDSVLSDSRLFLEAILPLLAQRAATLSAPLRRPPAPVDLDTLPLAPAAVFEAIRKVCPQDVILTDESPSNVPAMQDRFRMERPDSFYACLSSGGLGWTMPASIGLAMAERKTGRNRPVLCLIGDGSFQYSIQSLYTAVRQGADVVFVVLQNDEYGILKAFAEFQGTPNVPGLDLPGLDIVSLAKGFGAATSLATTAEEVGTQVAAAFARKGTSVVVVPITRKLAGLLG